jgi:large subunit ribosomal protein L32
MGARWAHGYRCRPLPALSPPRATRPGACVTRLEPCRGGLYPLRRWRARGQVQPPHAITSPAQHDRRTARCPTHQRRADRAPEPQGRARALRHSTCAPTRGPRGAGGGSWASTRCASCGSPARWSPRARSDWRLSAEAGRDRRAALRGDAGARDHTDRHRCDAALPRRLAGARGRRSRDARGRHDRGAARPLDLAAVMAEALALALPDYPRAPGRRDRDDPAIRRPRRHADDRRRRQTPGRALPHCATGCATTEDGRWTGAATLWEWRRGCRAAARLERCPDGGWGKGLAWPRNRSMFPASLALGDLPGPDPGNGHEVRGAGRFLPPDARRGETTFLTNSRRRASGAGGPKHRGCDMAVPQNRVTRSKPQHAPRARRADGANPNECPSCGELKRPHHVCPSCGSYNDREVVAQADEVDLDEDAA